MEKPMDLKCSYCGKKRKVGNYETVACLMCEFCHTSEEITDPNALALLGIHKCDVCQRTTSKPLTVGDQTACKVECADKLVRQWYGVPAA